MGRVKKFAKPVAYSAAWALVLALAAVRFGIWRPGEIEPYAAGEDLSAMERVTFAASDETVLVFVRSDCQYCKASMDFYRRLVAADAVRSGRVRVVMISSEPSHVLERYVSDNELVVQQIVSVRSDRLRGTPTLLIANRSGVIEGVWEGKLSPLAEQDVLDRFAIRSSALARGEVAQ